MEEQQFISLIQQHICGNLARVGGTVNHYIDYARCRVSDFNVADGGYGVAKQLSDRLLDKLIYHLKAIRKEWLFLGQGERIVRPYRTHIHDMHEPLPSNVQHSFDGCISSNMVEHSPNPILLLWHFHLLAKKDGWQFHAIPSGKHCFDMYREPTSIEHFIKDFTDKQTFADSSHVEDYRQSAIEKHGAQKNFHQRYPLSYPFIHQHVFDLQNARELFELLFTEVYVIFDQTKQWNDILVLARNNIREDFLQSNQKLLASYSDFDFFG